MRTKQGMSAKGRSSVGRKYKALFLDLDGTTVPTGKNQVSKKVKQAIQSADRMMNVSIATGRLFFQIEDIVSQLNLSGICVVANGIQLYDPVEKIILKEIGMNGVHIKDVYKKIAQYTKDIHFFDGKDELIYDDKNENQKVLSFYVPKITEKLALQITDSMTEFPKLTVHRLTTTQKGYYGLEICSASATKQHGIYEVAKILGIDTHEMIGVGDGYNDFPLLMACGLKIAMGNAVPELKAIADFVAPTVEEDGVATVIEKFILDH